MQNRTRIPRWLIEDDPAWQRTLDSDLGLLKWTKKGTNIQAVSSPASIFCEVSEVLETNDQTNVRNIASDLLIADIVPWRGQISQSTYQVGI